MCAWVSVRAESDERKVKDIKTYYTKKMLIQLRKFRSIWAYKSFKVCDFFCYTTATYTLAKVMFHTKPIENARAIWWQTLIPPAMEKRKKEKMEMESSIKRENNLSLIYWFSMIWLSSVDRNKCWYTIKRMRGLFVHFSAQNCCTVAACCCCYYYYSAIEAVRFAEALLLVVSLKL